MFRGFTGNNIIKMFILLKFCKKVCDVMKQRLKKYLMNWFTFWIVGSIGLAGLLEVIQYPIIKMACGFIVRNPLIFLCNVFIVSVTTVIIFFTKRKIFAFSVIAVIWLLLGAVSKTLVFFRGTPLIGSDFTLIGEGTAVMKTYLNTKFITIAIMAFIIIAIVLFFIFRFDKGSKRLKNIPLILVVLLFVASTPKVVKFFQDNHIVYLNYLDMYNGYLGNGFSYSLYNTTFKKKVEPPENYSKETIDNIVSSLTSKNSDNIAVTASSKASKKPNVIMVQLESFFDPTTLKGVTFDKDPIPNFRNLQKGYTSGLLSVPVLGGGTAQTEFEVNTGLSVKLLPLGNIAYNTVLNKMPVESLAYYLKDNGYSTHAMHDHAGSFYSRNLRFANLGFDDFTSIEYMNGYETNAFGWERDEVLVKQITDAMKSTDNSDFIYAVSVEAHGGYPEDYDNSKDQIHVTSNTRSNSTKSTQYYVNQIHDMDIFVGDLVKALNALGEPVIVAFYGDHLPGLNIDSKELTTQNNYKTPYLIWDNLGLKPVKEDLASYEIGTKMLNNIGLEGSIINQFHSTYDSEDNWDLFSQLEYDILFGKKYVYNGENPYKTSNLKMGFKPISISSVTKNGDKVTISGENFTKHSKVYINDKAFDTTFVDDKTLEVNYTKDIKDKKFVIKQIDRYNVTLGKTDIFTAK